MPAPKRRHQSSLIRHLIDQPQRFQFFQAVRIIDLWLRRGAPAHGRTLDTVLRFKNSISLSFPASQIEALSVDADVPVGSDGALQSTLDNRQLRRIRLTPAFMGFLGVNGVLPYDYTDTIAAQIYFDKNEAGRAFFDTFSHRSMTLFYRAWEKCRVEYRIDDKGRDGFLQLLLALAGRQATQASVRQQASQRRRASAVAPPDDGAIADEVAARNTMLGPRYWRHDLCVRLWIGPLSRADFDRFLPIGSGGKALKSVLALFAVPTVRFEVRPILRQPDITPVALNFQSRLGYGTFLVSKPPETDQDQTRYYITF